MYYLHKTRIHQAEAAFSPSLQMKQEELDTDVPISWSDLFSRLLRTAGISAVGLLHLLSFGIVLKLPASRGHECVLHSAQRCSYITGGSWCGCVDPNAQVFVTPALPGMGTTPAVLRICPLGHTVHRTCWQIDPDGNAPAVSARDCLSAFWRLLVSDRPAGLDTVAMVTGPLDDVACAPVGIVWALLPDSGSQNNPLISAPRPSTASLRKKLISSLIWAILSCPPLVPPPPQAHDPRSRRGWNDKQLGRGNSGPSHLFHCSSHTGDDTPAHRSISQWKNSVLPQREIWSRRQPGVEGGVCSCIFLPLASHRVYSGCAGPNPLGQCLPETPVITRLFTLQRVESSEVPGSNAAMMPAQTENVSVAATFWTAWALMYPLQPIDCAAFVRRPNSKSSRPFTLLQQLWDQSSSSTFTFRGTFFGGSQFSDCAAVQHSGAKSLHSRVNVSWIFRSGALKVEGNAD